MYLVLLITLNFKKMSKIKYITLIISMLNAIACTEIIEINNNDSMPEIVVEANIATNNQAMIKLSYSININDTSLLNYINNALVYLSENNTNTEKLLTTANGFYISPAIKGKINKKYQLKIEVDGRTITAESEIPNRVPIDTFMVENSIYPGGGPPLLPDQKAQFYEVRVRYNDPADEQNYYRIVLSLNNVVRSANNVYDDRLSNGRMNENLVILVEPDMKPGDVIGIELQCITKEMYEYYRSLRNFGGPGGSTPANPTTNLKGTKLGYFSAHTSEKVEYKIAP